MPSSPRTTRYRNVLPFAAVWLSIFVRVAGAQSASITPISSSTAALIPTADPEVFVERVPAELATEERQALWRQAMALEQAGRFREAAAFYERLVEIAPESPYPYWKVSRNFWRFAEALPTESKADRLPIFENAETWASRGLAVDSECAECMLWKFAALGRIATTRGIVHSLKLAPQMESLLEDAIALEPTFSDSYFNTSLGNLYYASAVFYRVIPDWLWLGWVLGVRGDLDTSLAMIRKAVEISPMRIDYTVELGAVLTCYGERKEKDWAAREGKEALIRAARFPILMDQDPLDLEHASMLVEDPGKACGYSRDGWIETDEIDRKHAEHNSLL